MTCRHLTCLQCEHSEDEGKYDIISLFKVFSHTDVNGSNGSVETTLILHSPWVKINKYCTVYWFISSFSLRLNCNQEYMNMKLWATLKQTELQSRLAENRTRERKETVNTSRFWRTQRLNFVFRRQLNQI